MRRRLPLRHGPPRLGWRHPGRPQERAPPRQLKAACSTVLCAVDTALPLARRREDSWNRIAVSATALALLDARWGGTRGAPLSALAGAAAVAAPWGIAWYISEWHSRLVCRRVAWMYYDLPRPTVPEPPKASIEYR